MCLHSLTLIQNYYLVLVCKFSLLYLVGLQFRVLVWGRMVVVVHRIWEEDVLNTSLCLVVYTSV